MYASRIAADHLRVAAVEGFPPAIDALARCNLGGYGFLRAAWYGACGSPGRTLLLRRGGPDGAVLAAIPTVAFGPDLAGGRKVPGSYWPLRAALVAPDCDLFELAHALGHDAARRLGRVWRVGPVRRDDPALCRLVAAARLANWTVLARPVGTSWVIDCDAARAAGWPRGSTTRKLRHAWRKLEALGTPRWRHVRGAAWSPAVLEELGQIEAQSWIARTTDGSGAKFMTEARRAAWRRTLGDPVLAESLVATILMLDESPIAFSFDLDDGPVRYGIACSYVEDLSDASAGKQANYKVMDDAIAAGQSLIDMGLGDSGYKQAMGAVAGYELVDLLFVRSRTAARILALKWGPEFQTPAVLAALAASPGTAHG